MIRTIIKYADKRVFLDKVEVQSTATTLPAGMYDLEFDRYGEFSNFIQISVPAVYSLMPSSQLGNLEEYIDIFLSDKYRDLCNDAKILRKTGIMLHGKQGIGKSNYINHIVSRCVEKENACVFNIDSSRDLYSIVARIKDLRGIQSNLFVLVMEEIDELLKKDDAEAFLKNLIDGINSVDNLLVLATTNYIETIPKALTDRPSRFKKVYEIAQTEDSEALKVWLSETYKAFVPGITAEECDKLHDLCINKTIDEIKHTLIGYKLGIKDVDTGKKLGFKK